MSRSAFIPALRFHSLTRFYDALLARTLKEDAFKRRLIAQASLEPGMRVLDLGCGTATLSLLVKHLHPHVEVHGLDADRETLALARDKAEKVGLELHLHQGLAQSPPFEDQRFDRLFSSLVFHHLKQDDKRRTLHRAYHLLRPGGELHIADWGPPLDSIQRFAFLAVQMLDGFETTRDSVTGVLPRLMNQVGFGSVEETHRERTVFGTLSLYLGTRPLKGDTD